MQTGHNRALRDLVRAKSKKGEGEEVKAMIQETTEQYKRAAAHQLNVCWTCGMDSTRSKFGGPLKLCKECIKIGRKVWYCSSLVTLVRSTLEVIVNLICHT